MKIRRFQPLKLTPLLMSSALVLGGLYSVDQAHGRGGTAPGESPVAIDPGPQPRLPSAQTLGNQRSQLLLADLDGAPERPQLQRPEITVCVDLPDWQRPSEQTQRKRLEQMPRYNGLLEDETLVSLAKDWWTHEAFSFTTYGLSARTDPHYLSGIWTALDQIWDCYGGEQPQQINAGELAELWLINHRLVELQWQDNQYVIIVEPSSSGLQLLQFARQDNAAALPVTMLTAAGQEVAVMVGDW